MDQVSVKKVASLAFLLVIMLLMALPLALAPAPPLMKSNNNGTTFCYNNGFVKEEEEGKESCHQIANDYLDMEFMMGSGISRMLDGQPAGSYTGINALEASKRACGRRERGQPYLPCNPSPRPAHPCSPYNLARGC